MTLQTYMAINTNEDILMKPERFEYQINIFILVLKMNRSLMGL